MRIRALLLASLLLASCGHLSEPSSQPSDTPPPPIVCPALVSADLVSEPLPPDGYDQDQLFDAFKAAFGEQLGLKVWEWFRVTWPGWGRANARALETAHEFCKDPTRSGQVPK